jgi:hypothetical protein
MKGCNHWVGGGLPRGLIPWRPCVDHGPMRSSIGVCHNIGSCAQLISAGTAIMAGADEADDRGSMARV